MDAQNNQILQRVDHAIAEWDSAKNIVQAAWDKVFELQPSINQANGVAQMCLRIIQRLKNFRINTPVTAPQDSGLQSVVSNVECFAGQLKNFETKYFEMIRSLTHKSDEAANFMGKLKDTRYRTLVLRRHPVVLNTPEISPPSPEWLNSVPWAEAQSLKTEWEQLDLYNKIIECEETLQTGFEMLVRDANW